MVVEANPNIELDQLFSRTDRFAKKLVKPAAKPTRKNAQVLSGNSNVRPAASKTLSEDEKLIARRMFPKDPKPFDRYIKAREKYA